MTPKDSFKSTKVLHLALLAGAALFFIVAIGVLKSFAIEYDLSKMEFFDYIPCALLLTLVNAFSFNRKILKSFDGDDLMEKLSNYRTRVIMRSAIIEGVALTTVAIALMGPPKVMITNILIFAIAWFLLLLMTPKLDELTRDYNISEQDKQRLV